MSAPQQTDILIRDATRADVPAIVRLLADDGLGAGAKPPPTLCRPPTMPPLTNWPPTRTIA